MRKYISYPFFITCIFLLVSCNSVSPEKYFSTAVLNSNLLHGFANQGLLRELESPGVRLVEGTRDQVSTMKRQEIIDTKIQFLETSFANIKGLRQNGDAKEMIQASLDLYEFALPVYKHEYRQLAKLYDDGASGEQTASFGQSINDKYYPRFVELHNKLIAQGKLYASKHNIKVNWDISTSPRN